MFRRTLIAVVAILAITGGTATAAKLITGKNVKNESLTGKDVKNGSLGAKELSSAARASLKGQTGATGAQGAKGDAGAKGEKGDKGDTGDRGPSNVFAARIEGVHTINSADDTREIIGGQLKPGKYLIQAKFVVKNHHAGIDANRPDCVLGIVTGADALFMPLDQVDVIVGAEPDTEEDVITLMGVADLAQANTPYAVRCEPTTTDGYDVRFRDRVLIATQVADLTAVGF